MLKNKPKHKNFFHSMVYLPMAIGTCIIFFFVSCEEVIHIDLNKANPRLVVEGWIYNQPGPYKIKLSLTTGYFDTAAAPMVDNAFVVITENDVVADTLICNEPGIYTTSKILQGKIGATYRLIIFYDGKKYEALSTLRPVADIDTLTYVYKEETRSNNSNYFVSIWFQEPSTPGNYYRWLFYKNNKIYKQHDEVYASDEFYNGNYIVFEFENHGVEWNDTVRIEMFSLDKAGYDFFRTLDETDNTGDLFDTPPGNAIGNVSNGAIGYFGASSVSSKEIVIR